MNAYQQEIKNKFKNVSREEIEKTIADLEIKTKELKEKLKLARDDKYDLQAEYIKALSQLIDLQEAKRLI